MKPCFITIEGIEGVGKSTVVNYLTQWFKQENIPHIMTREPGGTPISEAIRTVLLAHHQDPMADDTELLLVFAARAQHVQQVILPSLEKGLCVVSDRFTDASFAYQGGGRGIEASRIKILETWVQGTLHPDLTILLDAPIDIAFSRATSRSLPDRIEQAGRAFFENVRKAYLERAAQEPRRIKVVDANQPIDVVQKNVIEVIKQYAFALA